MENVLAGLKGAPVLAASCGCRDTVIRPLRSANCADRIGDTNATVGLTENELNLIQREGLAIGDKTFHFKIRAFIADSPARAFIKATTSYVGYDGCLKCSVSFEYDDFGKKIIFNTVDAPLRTDEGFRNRVCPDHHKSWRTPHFF
uniref:Uncharacterized protein n=1 Tax=Anopheles minimus TaxID=112268 RepID=A0A182WAZ4_9DIPT